MNNIAIKNVHDTLKRIMNEDWTRSRSSAFGYITRILDNRDPVSHQIKDIEEVVSIWKDLDKNLAE